MPERRAYQERTIDATFEAWRKWRRVLDVIPTGGGKTYIAERIIQRAQCRTLFAVHGKELVRQTAERFSAAFGHVDIIDATHEPRGSMVSVASIDTLLARGSRPEADLVVWDEVHRLPSDRYREVAEHYRSRLNLGLTATPERSDGRPLGDLFEHLIVGANYSELIDGGYLLPCRVFRPTEILDGLAQDPLAAYQRYAPGTLCIGFLPSVELAYKHAERFTEAGFPAVCVEAETKNRKAIFDRFVAGDIRVLLTVNVLTEGVDLPACETILLGRMMHHVSTYLQAAGRGLRPHGSMQRCTLIDLIGMSREEMHGPPTIDRLYSLDGTPIRRASDTPLHTCVECGATFPSAMRTCPVCGDERPCATPKPPRIYSVELQEVWAGENTPDDVKLRELERLRGVAGARGFGLAWVSEQYSKTFGERPALGAEGDARRQEAERLVARCKEKGWSFYAVVKQYKATFGEEPDLSWVPDELKREEHARLVATAAAKGYKPGWAGFRYKALFGSFPRRAA